MTEPVVIRPNERDGVPTAAGGDIYATLATGAETSGSHYTVHAVIPAGGGPPAHVHTREDEAFFLLSGELTFLVGEEEVALGAGTFINVPRGTKHRFRNTSDQDAEMIFWFAPAGIEGLFAELGKHPEDIVAIGEKYGVEYFFDE
jgi:mannose-6-phosphate isomerase-like protein (cupin superfamily)